jgi:HNH endonuclease
VTETEYRPKQAVRRYPKPPDGKCLCGCGGEPAYGGHLPGHWNKTAQGRALARRTIGRGPRPSGREHPSYKGSVAERVQAKLAPADERGCRRFRGRHLNGYGATTDDDGTVKLAHRVVYIEAFGVEALDEGTCLHHRCSTRDCCSVEHLVPLSRADHARLHWRLKREAAA